MEAPAKETGKNLLKNIKKNVKLSFFKVNLLINKEQQPKLYVRFLKWALSSGRFFVILVELVTISAFVYRYKLDSDLIDLQEEIKIQRPYIESLKNEETLIRQIQFQLASAKQIYKESPDFAAILIKLSQLIPQTAKLISVSFNNTQISPASSISINGQSPTTSELSLFVKTLQKDPAFSEISLTNISFEEGITFTITGTVTGNLSQKGNKGS